MIIIQIVSLATGLPCKEADMYLKDFDVDAFCGCGHLTVTPDIDDARRFPTVQEAFQFWRRQSKVRPYRPDNKPNRPLTAYTIEMVPVK